MHPGTVALNDSGNSLRTNLVGSFLQALCPSFTGSISQASGRGESFKVHSVVNSRDEFIVIDRNHLRHVQYHLHQSRFLFEPQQR